MFFVRKDSIINNFKKYQPNIYRNCVKSVSKAKLINHTYYLNKGSFIKEIRQNILIKKMFIIDHGVVMLIYLKVKTF